MSAENPVKQILVASANSAPLAKGKKPAELAVGQIGVFDKNTNLSVDATSAASTKLNTYILVGTDPKGSGSLEDVKKSAGQFIASKGLTSLETQCYVAPVAQKLLLDGFQAECSTDYSVKFEIRNQQGFRTNGYNQVVKTFVVQSDDCEGCESCPSGDCIGLARKIVDEVNLDPDGLILAELYDVAGGAVVPNTDSDVATWVTANADTCLGVQFTVQPQDFKNYADVNLNYFFPHGTLLVPSVGAGFEANGSIVTTTDMVFEQGAGQDVKQMEYETGGFSGNPGTYRQLEDGMQRDGYKYYADNAETYVVINLSYESSYPVGFKNGGNFQETVIAVPSGNATALTGIKTIFDSVFAAAGSVESC
tara:strand:- start:901 stop:1992 length:1092 start_codon:yes stop_codon:yes gene_type:complete